ncbi:MAG: DUF2281 domain-containing protein [Candidatus Brocadia sp.]
MIKLLDEMIRKLPPEYQQEVEDFVEFIFQNTLYERRQEWQIKQTMKIFSNA